MELSHKSIGLGDTIEKITVATGVKKLVNKVTEVLKINDCGCNKRKDILNEMFPYNNNK